jgi:hypothetical protein
MFAMEVILNQPFGQSAVELIAVNGEIAIVEPLIFKRLVESFANRVVLRCPRP